jgi:hypothetical protein
MDRVYFQNSRHLTLIGCFHPADSKAAIVMAHGFTNDKSSQGRFDALAESFNGMATMSCASTLADAAKAARTFSQPIT